MLAAFLLSFSELTIVPATRPNEPVTAVLQAGPHRYCRQAAARDDDTPGVQSVDTSRDTDPPPRPASHPRHAAIGVRYSPRQ
jgi:hypothetical protein